jgi:hypothetical protein
MKYELINAIPRIAFSITTAAHRVKTQCGEIISEEVYEVCVWVMAIRVVEFSREGYKI